MTPRDSTGSIVPGLSIPSIVRRVALVYGVPVDRSLFDMWRSITDLMCHFDDWLESSTDEGRLGCIDFLSGTTGHDSLMLLSCRQQQSFKQVLHQFQTNHVSSAKRTEFLAALRSWAHYSDNLRSTASVRSALTYRCQESRCLASLLILVVPDNFGREVVKFSDTLSRITVTAQFIDSVIDFKRDIAVGAVSPPRRRLQILFALAAVLTALRCALVTPRLLPILIRKSWILVINRNGRFNSQRVND